MRTCAEHMRAHQRPPPISESNEITEEDDDQGLYEDDWTWRWCGGGLMGSAYDCRLSVPVFLFFRFVVSFFHSICTSTTLALSNFGYCPLFTNLPSYLLLYYTIWYWNHDYFKIPQRSLHLWKYRNYEEIGLFWKWGGLPEKLRKLPGNKMGKFPQNS